MRVNLVLECAGCKLLQQTPAVARVRAAMLSGWVLVKRLAGGVRLDTEIWLCADCAEVFHWSG